MAVRRLAEIQPESFDFTPDNQRWVEKQIAKYPAGRQASAVMALLRRAQNQHDGWLPKPAIEKVAAILEMPDIRVLEIATFYSMYNLAPVGKFFIQMCGTTPCMLRGSDGIKAVLAARVGEQGHVTADGVFSWLEVECLGACCNAPMVQINDDYYEDLTPENFAALLDDLAAGKPVKTGSQGGRLTSEPAGGLTTLIELYGRDGHSGPSRPVVTVGAPEASAGSEQPIGQDNVPVAPMQGGTDLARDNTKGLPQGSVHGTGTHTEVPVGEKQVESSAMVRAPSEETKQPVHRNDVPTSDTTGSTGA